ncbi:MAG: four helix bundle protein [Bacteroidales bacterium]|nr:four helix bundle protein [Bacteroidales bacterium]
MAYKIFTEMPVWQKAFKLLLKVYEVTKGYPTEEKYGLISDMRRAANSVTNNISEGFGRYEKLDKTRFYKITRGSCYELINQSLASQALGFITDKDKDEFTNGYRDVINGLDSMIKSIETTLRK